MIYFKLCEGNKLLLIGTKPAGSLGKGEIEITQEEYEELDRQIDERVAKIDKYCQDVLDDIITLNDVPAEYYDAVYKKVTWQPPAEPYTLEQVVDKLLSEVNS